MQVSWKPDVSGNWSVASNWSTGTVPNSGDDVVIQTAHIHTITHSTGDDVVNSLLVQGDGFTLSGGSLEVLTTASFNSTFNQTGGELIGATVTFAGSSKLLGGDVTGSTAITANGALSIAGYSILGASTLTNTATAKETGNITIGDESDTGATLSNAATGVFNMAGLYSIYSDSATATVINAGLFTKTAGHGTGYIDTNFTSTGTVSVNTGGTIALDGDTNYLGGTLTGSGVVELGAYTNSTLALSAAPGGRIALDNNATVTLANSVTLLAGLIDTGNANVINTGSYALTIGGMATLSSGLISGNGALTLQGNTSIGYNFRFGGALQITNTGVVRQSSFLSLGDAGPGIVKITNAATGIYELTAAGSSIYSDHNAATSFVNKGLFEKIEQGDYSNIGVAFTNQSTGTIAVALGTMYFQQPLTNAGTITGAGTIDLQADAKFVAGTVLSIAELDLSYPVALTLTTGLTYGGALVLGGGSTINIAAKVGLTLASSSVSQLGGSGTGDLTGGGILTNQGSVSIYGFEIDQTSKFNNAGTVNEYGDLVVGDSFGNIASVTNAAGGRWNIYSGDVDPGVSPGSQYVNNGTLSIYGGNDSIVDRATISNTKGGTVNIASGSLDIAAYGTLANAGKIIGSDLFVSQSSVISLSGGSTIATSTFELGPVLEVIDAARDGLIQGFWQRSSGHGAF